MIGAIISTVTTLIDRIFPDKAKAAEAKIELLKLQTQGELQKIAAASEVVSAEIKGDSWLQRNWRPITMILFVIIIANNYLIAPYLISFGYKALMLDLPQKMWSLLEIGLGGYIIGRSAEKVTKIWRK